MAPNVADRRTFLLGAAATVATASLAGCLRGEDESDGDDETEPIVDVAEALEGDTDPDLWRDVEEIRLDGYVGGWVGVEPAHIDRVENPTLVLFVGHTYEIAWENRDNMKHNLAIWNADDERVEGHATDVVADEGGTETLAFTPTAEMAIYICEHQPGIQRGDLEIVDETGEPLTE